MAQTSYQDTVQRIAERLEIVMERIEQSCRRSGRSVEEVCLVAVTKTFSAETVRAGYEAGLRDFGENRVQELVEKAEALPGAYRGGPIRWHMIGHAQRNKAKAVVETADLFHSLDSPRLAKVLNQRAEEEGRVLPCLLQVNVSGESSKFGVPPENVEALLEAAVRQPSLRIKGLMTIASLVDDAEDVRPEFQQLYRLFESLRAQAGSRYEMAQLSMGMSDDFEVAIEEGATHIRLGSALFGPRH